MYLISLLRLELRLEFVLLLLLSPRLLLELLLEQARCRTETWGNGRIRSCGSCATHRGRRRSQDSPIGILFNYLYCIFWSDWRDGHQRVKERRFPDHARDRRVTLHANHIRCCTDRRDMLRG